MGINLVRLIGYFLGATVIASGASSAPTLAQQAQSYGVVADTTTLMRCTDGVDGGLGPNIICDDTGNLDTGEVAIFGPHEYKLSSSGDLMIDVNLECLGFTEVKATRNSKNNDPSISDSSAGLVAWVVIDDDDALDEVSEIGFEPHTVGVTTQESDPDKGKVRFCNRVVELEIGGGDSQYNEDEFVRLLISTVSTHGFKWVQPNPADIFGTNTLYVSLVGLVSLSGSGDHVDGVGFGKRLMTVENHHL